jgi:hypothetical protein
MEFEQKKMAIEQGLIPFLSAGSLTSALRLWEAKYAGEPTFALTRFISELGDSAALGAPHGKVLQSLIRALNHLPASPPVHRRAVPIPETRETRDDATRACTLLVDTLIDHLPPDQGDGIRRYVIDHLDRLQQPVPVLNAVRAWLSRRQPMAMPIVESALIRIVNLAYVALCESVGPTKADRALHEAVLISEKASAGSGFPVRRLL